MTGKPLILGILAAMLLSGCSSDETFFATPAGAVGSQTTKKLTRVNLEKAHALRLAGDYAGAVKILGQLVLVNADNGAVLGEYGKVLTQQGRADEAVEFLTRAVQLVPADWSLFSALGVAYDEKGDAAKARTAYLRALEIRPEEPTVLNNYALSRLMAGDPENARALIARARAVAPATGKIATRIAHNTTLIAQFAAASRKSGAAASPHPKKTGVPIVTDAPGTFPEPRARPSDR